MSTKGSRREPPEAPINHSPAYRPNPTLWSSSKSHNIDDHQRPPSHRTATVQRRTPTPFPHPLTPSQRPAPFHPIAMREHPLRRARRAGEVDVYVGYGIGGVAVGDL